MSKEYSRNIDMIGKTNNSNDIVIGVIDDIENEDDHEHLELLLHKLNVILDYVVGGQISEKYSNWQDCQIEIRVIFKIQPSENVIEKVESLGHKIKDVVPNSTLTIQIR